MKVGVNFQLTGVRELDRRLKSLGVKMENKIAMKALTAAGKPMIQAIKRKAPVRTKTLKKSIGTKRKSYKNGVAILIIGPRRGKRYHGAPLPDGTVPKPTSYAHLVEFGTKNTAAHPFMRPTFRSQKDKAKQRFIAKVLEEVNKAARKPG